MVSEKSQMTLLGEFLDLFDSQKEKISICVDSRKFKTGDVFIAVRGALFDGHSFVEEACHQGAWAVVVEDVKSVPESYKGIICQTQNNRKALAEIAHRKFSKPSDSLFCIGLTGTNGKTTVSYMIESLLSSAKVPTGVMGTVDHHLADKVWPSSLTTPDSLILHQRLSEFLQKGAKAVVMEVSSHSLLQKRVETVSFDVGVFTNLSQDHLDYHGDMESYRQAKELLFSYFLKNSLKDKKWAVVNGDDSVSSSMVKNLRSAQGVEIILCRSQKSSEDQSFADKEFVYDIIESNLSGSRFVLKTGDNQEEFFLPVAGDFNIQNAVVAIATAMCYGISLQESVEGLRGFQGVPGRLQSLEKRGRKVFVDYAHTPDALEKVLKEIHALRDSSRNTGEIFVVFGCGGDRDKGKRPQMAIAVEKWANQVFLTSDNPRSEEPLQIIQDISQGFSDDYLNQSVICEPDRKQAIERCLREACEGDVILIAGKGHEQEQVIGDEVIPFNDYSIAKEILDGLESET